MSDCVYQAFKKLGIEYPQHTPQTMEQIQKFCEENDLEFLTDCYVEDSLAPVIAIGITDEPGTQHAVYAESFGEVRKRYSVAENAVGHILAVIGLKKK